MQFKFGDQYLFVAQDQDSKLIVTYALGKRNSEVTDAFAADLAQRINLMSVNAAWSDKPQVSTDGWQAYPGAMPDAFGSRVNYGQIVKAYAESEQPGRSVPERMAARIRQRPLHAARPPGPDRD